MQKNWLTTRNLYLFKYLKEELTVSELAKKLGMFEPSVHRLVKLLETHHICKTRTEKGKRLVSLTKKAHSIRPDICRLIDTLNNIHSWTQSRSK